jgi:hypothetical protein
MQTCTESHFFTENSSHDFDLVTYGASLVICRTKIYHDNLDKYSRSKNLKLKHNRASIQGLFLDIF